MLCAVTQVTNRHEPVFLPLFGIRQEVVVALHRCGDVLVIVVVNFDELLLVADEHVAINAVALFEFVDEAWIASFNIIDQACGRQLKIHFKLETLKAERFAIFYENVQVILVC